MRIPASRTLVLAAVLALLVGCTGNGDDGRRGTSTPLEERPLRDDEVTLHLTDPPELPPALAGAEVTTSELRTSGLTERHIVELVDVPADVSTLASPLGAGAVLRVGDGQEVVVEEDVDVAELAPGSDDDPSTVGELTTPCSAPCTVTGPALVMPAGWSEGIVLAPDWQLLVPSPVE